VIARSLRFDDDAVDDRGRFALLLLEYSPRVIRGGDGGEWGE
jgi:hypothetical protein